MSDRAHKEIEVLYRISQAMVHQQDLSSLLEEVLNILEKEMGMSYGTLTLRRPDTDIFDILASRGLTSQEKHRGQYHLGEGITGIVAKTGKPELIPEISKDTRFLYRTGARKKEKAAFICVPFIHQRQVIGTMSIDRPSAEKSELLKDLNFLVLISNLLAEAVAGTREQIRERNSLLEENKRLKNELGDRFNPSNIIGNCNNMKNIYQQIAQVSDSMATVLIRGESGTGKELVARAIHQSSSRKNRPFISINCAALPENLIESELFGHEKGAFTGAASQRKGRFELANTGTLFLDEIGDISPVIQVRLLRVLQEREFERVGGTKTIEVNVRIIAATSRNLEKAISDGTFREDLYYRLNVYPVHVPPLRERRSDIILLADYFLDKYSKNYNKSVKRISSTAINMMMSYHWPGNVRELENCIERAILISTDEVVHGYNLPPSLQTSDETHTALIPTEGACLRTMVNSYEKEIIVDALKRFRGNVAAACRHLQTTQRILHYRIEQLEISSKDYK